MQKPNINVTPLIDVLLVLLIIFMVVSPMKPSDFKTRAPSEPKITQPDIPNPKTLLVTVGSDLSLKLNAENDNLATTNDPTNLIRRLNSIFEQRIANGDVSESFADDPGRPGQDHIERTVFIKAPRTVSYGSVAKVIDAVKVAGAYPISLQIDEVN